MGIGISSTGSWQGRTRSLLRVHLPPLLEALGPAELEHLPKHNRVRAR